jgi:hypothetical protein
MPNFPLVSADLVAHQIRPGQIAKLTALIEKNIAESRYPGCQIALARHGKLLPVSYRIRCHACPCRNLMVALFEH